MNEILIQLQDLEQQTQEYPDLLKSVRAAIEDLVEPVGKENARMAIMEVRNALINMEAPDTERSPTFILPPPSEDIDSETGEALFV